MRPGAAKRLRRDGAVFAALCCAYVLAGLLVTNSYYQLILVLVPIWAVFGLSWNLFSGYSGLVSFGHAAFFGIGAYTVTLLLVDANVTPWLGIPAAAVLGGAAALLIALPTLRLRGHYFALAMLAYPLVMLYVVQYLGLQEVPLPMKRQNPLLWLQFVDARSMILVAVGLLVIAMVISMWVETSRFGLLLTAVRQNELAAEAAGVDTRRVKVLALMASGAMAAASGGLYACVLLIVTPDSVFGVLVSAQALTLVMFGGVGTYWGALIGAAVLIPLSDTLQAELGDVIPGIQGVVYGATIILVMLLAPEGVFWSLRERLRRRSRAVAPSVAAPLAPLVPMVAVKHRAPGRTLLEVQGLSKRFGGLQAVSDVSFSVAEGSILGIIGPNGAGKTTLFNVLNGVLPASSGQALLGGQRITARALHQVCRMGVGRTFQVVRSFPRLSLLDNVLAGAYGAGLADRVAQGATAAALATCGLTALAGTPANGLTNKDLRLMELARALAAQPRLLLLDETLAGLGHDECEEVLGVLDRLRNGGMTVIIIEHTMQAMMRIADEFLVMDRGRTLARGLPQEVVADRTVIEAYLGKKWLTKIGQSPPSDRCPEDDRPLAGSGAEPRPYKA